MRLSSALLFLLAISQAIAYEQEIILVIENIIHLDNKPIQVTVLNNCWDFDNTKKMILTLGVPINFPGSNDPLNGILYDVHFLTFIIDLNCNGSIEFLQKMPPKYLGHPFTWIIIGETTDNLTEKTHFLPSLPIFVDSNIVLITRDLVDNFNLQQLYKLAKDSNSYIAEPFGTWSPSNGFQDMRPSPILARRRKNLQQTGLASTLVIRNEDTLNHLRDYRDRGVDSVTKYTFQLIDTTFTIMNASGTYLSAPLWGYFNETTQKYSGMMGDLVNGVADIGGTMLFMTPNRVPVVDYFCVLAPSTVQFLFRQPALSTVSNIYILPFNTSVWYCSALLILISSVVIFVTIAMANRGEDQRANNRFTDTLVLAIGAACQMGSNFEPKAISGRISTLFLFVGLLFLYTSYTANIVALLQSTTNDIQSLEDMMRAQFEFGAENNSYNRYYFKTETEPLRKLVYDTKVAPNDNFMNTSIGLDRMRRGLFAFHLELGPAYKYIEDNFYEHEKCGLTEVKFLEIPEVCLAIQKNSPYKETLRTVTFQLREIGIVQRELRKLYTQKPTCDKSGQNFKSIGLNDCYLLIKVIFYGHLLAIGIFVLEKCAHTHRMRGACLI